jgi:hypothetical protein
MVPSKAGSVEPWQTKENAMCGNNCGCGAPVIVVASGHDDAALERARQEGIEEGASGHGWTLLAGLMVGGGITATIMGRAAAEERDELLRRLEKAEKEAGY